MSTIDIRGQITAALNNQVKRFSYKSLGEKGHLLSSYQNHKQILKAIRKRDKELAEKITREHILNGMKVLQKNFATQIQK